MSNYGKCCTCCDKMVSLKKSLLEWKNKNVKLQVWNNKCAKKAEDCLYIAERFKRVADQAREYFLALDECDMKKEENAEKVLRRLLNELPHEEN